MDGVVEVIKATLLSWGELTEVSMNALSLVCVVTGVLTAIVRSIQERRRSPGVHPMHTYFRRMLAGWLILALEFQLAADIVGAIISPVTSQLIELGAVALIRTFLNYFLNKELIEFSKTTHTGGEKVEELALMRERD